jgi:hypothetical protein
MCIARVGLCVISRTHSLIHSFTCDVMSSTQVICVYGLQQGLGNAWFFQARDYYLKDVLDLSPAQAQAYHSATYTPWSSKYIQYYC